jgi:hypothetical protein
MPQTPQTPRDHAGPTVCLGCDQPFERGAHRTSRLCPRCQAVFAQLPFEGLPAPLPRAR